jgi:hypothetical protein
MISTSLKVVGLILLAFIMVGSIGLAVLGVAVTLILPSVHLLNFSTLQ